MENTNHHHECNCGVCGHKHHKKGAQGGGVSSGVYGLAFIGALVYYIQHADTFWAGVLGVLKAIIWPAMLVYNLLGFLGM